ncbi:hypothetical protein FB567DRAFT_45656 [Paraphoma chrysanthemicola]|uniref:Uncharacterized protein n=1 Tax=Paraphoma chrysanthemicola TaxID=798071 RepID=A0A8K0W4R9_9PLEO|nr:hypothetical protein FB567DRAFT_45656 [Paraphoma chrysanthemicola]
MRCSRKLLALPPPAAASVHLPSTRLEISLRWLAHTVQSEGQGCPRKPTYGRCVEALSKPAERACASCRPTLRNLSDTSIYVSLHFRIVGSSGFQHLAYVSRSSQPRPPRLETLRAISFLRHVARWPAQTVTLVRLHLAHPTLAGRSNSLTLDGMSLPILPFVDCSCLMWVG